MVLLLQRFKEVLLGSTFLQGGNMATILGTTTDIPIKTSSASYSNAGAASILVPLGRLLFSLIFIVSGFRHFSSEMIMYAASQNVPMASFLVPLSGAMAILGGLSILLGYKARYGALLLLAFLIPVTLMMHNFWAMTDPMMYQMQMSHFMKNTALIGAAVLIYFFGSGPSSLDRTHISK